MSLHIHDAYDHLRRTLLEGDDVGDSGFEGLVATVLANLTGLTIRLAKSGSQYGRDGMTPNGPFAIAMEAKRYADKLRLETLAGKATIASFALANRIDVWVIGATSEIGDDTEDKIRMILEKEGISLIALDWSAAPSPRLAIALAAAKEPVIRWFERHRHGVDPAKLRLQLETIGAQDGFAERVDQLVGELTPSRAGIGALRLGSELWLKTRFADSLRSQQAFGQFVCVSDPSLTTLPRSGTSYNLEQAVQSAVQERSVVVVTGEEGAGKTWLVANWWASLPEPPIMIFVAGRRSEAIDPRFPVESLARLLAEQEERSDPASIESWRRRIERWSTNGDQNHLRFAIVLDGLNEHANRPWADAILGLSKLAFDLGGVLIVTSRPHFWKRDVAVRLNGSLRLCPVEVGCYTDDELKEILSEANINLQDLPPKVRSFIRNPRVCAVATNVIESLAIDPSDLTVDRLLLEYWQWRLRERSDLIAHNIQDFEKLLRSHAKTWIDQQQAFDRDDWAEHSGVMRRGEDQRGRSDLTEIEEGRFLTITNDDLQSYEFRPESLAFAIGLLINEELKSTMRNRTIDVDAALDSILDPVRGFDQIADIVAAATGLACLNQSFPSAAATALVRYWLGLQNVGEEAFSGMAGYVSARPDVYLDVAETQEGDGVRGRTQSLSGLLVYKRDHPAVRSALEARLPKWLANWSREPAKLGFNDDTEKRVTQRENHVNISLSAMTESELDTFQKFTWETPRRTAMRLDHLASMLMASRPLAPLAGGFFGWTLRHAVAPEFDDASADIAWVSRLNRIDTEDFSSAVDDLVSQIDTNSSPAMRKAAAALLRLTGDPARCALANVLTLEEQVSRRRRVERYCETNPHDPAAMVAGNLESARDRMSAISPELVWQFMSPTADDHDWDAITPALARFDFAFLRDAMRRVIATVKDRKDLTLRQLGWRLPALSPLFDEKCVTAVLEKFREILADPTILAEDDRGWICSSFVQALNPHVSANEQLELILGLPPGCALYENLQHAALPLDAADLENCLESSTGEGLIRVVFFASASRARLTPRTRELILSYFDGNTRLAAMAADLAFRAEDAELDRMLLGLPAGVGPQNELSFSRARALAAAMIRQQTYPEEHILPFSFSGSVANALGGQSLADFGDLADDTLSRMLRPVAIEEPTGGRLHFQTSADGMSATRWVDTADDEELDFSKLQNVTKTDAADKRHETRQREIRTAVRRYYNDLDAGGIGAIATAPSLNGLDRVSQSNPSFVMSLANRLLSVNDVAAIRQSRNLGLTVAKSVAQIDPATSAALFTKLKDVIGPVKVVVDEDRISLFEFTLFSTPNVSELSRLKRDVFMDCLDDASLEAATIAADRSSSGVWLDDLVDGLMLSSNPADIARGLTISGLRWQNAKASGYLAMQPEAGFLADVAGHARENAERASWAHYWFNLATAADVGDEFWRYGVLAAGVADQRFTQWDWTGKEDSMIARFGRELRTAIRKSAEKRSGKRKSTLFGIKAPDRDLKLTLADQL